MKTKGIITSLILLGFVMTSFQAQSQRQSMNRNQTCSDIIPDLTEDQETQIKTLHDDFYAERTELKADLAIKRAEKHKLMIADDPDVKAINAKIDEMAKLRTQMQKERAAMHIAMKDILTDEQVSVWESKMHKRGHYNSGRHNNSKGSGQGDGMHDGRRMKDKRGMHRPCMN